MAITKAEYAKAKAAVEKATSSGAATKTSDGGYTINSGKNAGTSISSTGAVTKSTGTVSKGTNATTNLDPSLLQTQLAGGDTSKYGLQNKSTTTGTTTGTTGTTGTTTGTTSNTNSSDIYGDMDKVNKGGTAIDFSGDVSTISKDQRVYGSDATTKASSDANYLSNRNTSIAKDLYDQGVSDETGIRSYLDKIGGKSWEDASDIDKNNTVNAIYSRLTGISNNGGSTTTGDTKTGLTAEEVDAEKSKAKDGYYMNSDGTYTKIYGYDTLPSEYQNLIDRMSDTEKKKISNDWANGMQEEVKAVLDTRIKQDQLKDQQDIQEDLYDINRETSLIQAEQTLRNAEESYNNLKQNWQYLGNMGMPGTSATKIQAIGDCITEAKTTLGEIKKLTQLSLDAQEKQWEGQVLEYNQQIENLQYDLDWKVSKEVQGLLGEFTTAELKGQLDTIDGITAFRKELLDNLDANLSGITSASLEQMQYITQQYQDIADKMETYAQNKNTVNTDMSAVKGYYVDGNGEAILNTKGEVIEVPQSAPLDPVFDTDTGKLITFDYDENGQIVANVQQVYSTGNNTNAQIVSMLSQGYSVSDVVKAYPDVDLDTVQSLANVVKADYTKSGMPTTYQGKTYTAVDTSNAKSAVYSMPSSGTGGWCGEFVNKYLQKLGFSSGFFGDSLQSKLNNINSDTPTVGSVVVFDYNHITPETGENNGHVGIVMGFKDGKMIVKDSNFDGDRQIKVREVDPSSSSIKGYFDPSISINDYNSSMQQQVSGGTTGSVNENGFKSTMTGYYDKFLSGKFTSEDSKQYNTQEFQNELANYKAYKEAQVSDYTTQILKSLYNLQNIGWLDYNNAALGIPRTDGYAYKKDFDTLMSNATLKSLTDAKANNVSFGALSDAELSIISDAMMNIDFSLSRDEFNKRINAMINDMEQGLIDNGASNVLNSLKQQTKTSGKNKVSGGNLS